MNTVKRSFSLGKFFCIVGVLMITTYCGVPDPLERNIISPPYEFKATTSNQTITLLIKGYYPIDQVPFFNGFNVYYGETSNFSDIVRKLYTDERLPTIEDNPTQDGFVDISFTLDIFRYKAEEEDELQTENINLYQSYFFSIKAINNKTGKEGAHHNRRIEARPCTKVYNREHPQNDTVLFIGNLSYTFENDFLGVQEQTLLLPGGYYGSNFANIHHAPLEDTQALYTASSHPLHPGYVYFLKNGNNYALIYLVSFSSEKVIYHYFYQEGKNLF